MIVLPFFLLERHLLSIFGDYFEQAQRHFAHLLTILEYERSEKLKCRSVSGAL